MIGRGKGWEYGYGGKRGGGRREIPEREVLAKEVVASSLVFLVYAKFTCFYSECFLMCVHVCACLC